jgi:putative oxidoreductase
MASTIDDARYIWAPRMRSILRMVAGFLILQHGTQKLFGFPANQPSPPVELLSRLGLASVIEIVCGLLLILGLFTRPAAFVLAGEMAVAYFIAHVPRGLLPLLNGGEPAVLNCFIFLYLCVAGAGPWSLDARRGVAAGDPLQSRAA